MSLTLQSSSTQGPLVPPIVSEVPLHHVYRSTIEWGHCSWCFHTTHHARTDMRVLRRNVFFCAHCLHRTVKCAHPGCPDFARGFEKSDYDEISCYYHRGLITHWADAAPSEVAASERFEKTPEQEVSLINRWCSWCMQRTDHSLMRRNIYECTFCCRPTRACKKCDVACARSFGLGGGLCLADCGFLSSWDSPKEEAFSLLIRHALCPHCLEVTSHILIDKNRLTRDDYQCELCSKPTVLCTRCNSSAPSSSQGMEDFPAMAKSHQRKCLRCKTSKPKRTKSSPTWFDILKCRHEHMIASHGPAYILDQFGRNSKERQKAIANGVIRPFLLLVSMTPELRHIVAAQLGIDLVRPDVMGFPHAEAWKILHTPGKGLISRAKGRRERFTASNANWYDILIRANDVSFPIESFEKATVLNSHAASIDSSDTTIINGLEMSLLEKLAQSERAKWPDALSAELDLIIANCARFRRLDERLQRNGITSDGVRRWVFEMAYEAYRHQVIFGENGERLSHESISRLRCEALGIHPEDAEAVGGEIVENMQRRFQGESRARMTRTTATTVARTLVTRLLIAPIFPPLGLLLTVYSLSKILGARAVSSLPAVWCILLQRVLVAGMEINLDDFY